MRHVFKGRNGGAAAAGDALLLQGAIGGTGSRPAPDPAPSRSPGRERSGFRLAGEPVTLESGPDLLSHKAYTVLIDFCKEETDDGGCLVRFDGSFSLWAWPSSLEATIHTTRGERRLLADGLKIEVGRWYGVALRFSGRTGRAELFLDGTEVAAISGLDGAEQAGNLFADLQIGSADGDSFPGLLDRFRFVDAALARDDLLAP